MRNWRRLAKDLYWVFVLLLPGIVAGWFDERWWFVVFFLLVFALLIVWLRPHGDDGEA